MKITYRIEAQQDDTPVRGNAMVSGDAEFDRKCEDEILARLDRGDVWAWAAVTVIAEVETDTGETFEGRDYLGACSYASEADFVEAGDYYPVMCKAALEDLKMNLRARVQDGEMAAKVLSELGAP